jgi:pimeloyl-ACP methyl ester carboxylesterase
MRTFSFSLDGGLIHCRQTGRGPKLAVCLHGFADDATRFSPLAEELSDVFTVVMPDLPAHGSTQWQSSEFTVQHMLALIKAILSHKGHATCTIIAHSWGARLTIPSLPYLLNYVEQVWLIAPGGFEKGSRWGGELLSSTCRNSLINHVVNKPGAWLTLVKIARKLKLLSSGQASFFSSVLINHRKTSQLAFVWRNLPNFSIRSTPTTKLKLPIFFVVGTKDMLISHIKVRRFVRMLPLASLTLIKDGGHWPTSTAIASSILKQQPTPEV